MDQRLRTTICACAEGFTQWEDVSHTVAFIFSNGSMKLLCVEREAKDKNLKKISDVTPSFQNSRKIPQNRGASAALPGQTLAQPWVLITHHSGWEDRRKRTARV